MKVMDGLLSVCTVIHDAPVSGFGNALLRSNAGGDPRDIGGKALILIVQSGEARHMLPGNNQDVHRRLGINISEGNDVAVLKHNVGRDLSHGDAAEKALSHRSV